MQAKKARSIICSRLPVKQCYILTWFGADTFGQHYHTNPPWGDNEYVGVDEGGDEELDEEDRETIDSDEAADKAEETAEEEDQIHGTDDKGLNENKELRAEGAGEPTQTEARKNTPGSQSNDFVGQPGLG
ncbi:MAG TPA: hypothetical protein VHE59_14935 [Mucilaginibacter sp.]|nr:hypothetical protein [Mucilaginibacter sp.]